MKTLRARMLPPILIGVLILFAAVAVQAAVHSVVVVGLGGNEDYRSEFEIAASQIVDATQPATVELGRQQTLIGDEVTKDSILAALQEVAGQINDDDHFVLTLIGHGSFDAERYRFNVRGPDLTDQDLIKALAAITASHQLVVVATSASGALLQLLEEENRTLVTATKSGGEINAVKFPGFWSEALSLDLADVDHNELLTIQEAFEYASSRVDEHYQNENLMATEHPRISGDSQDDLVLARLGSLRGHDINPVVNRLLEDRQALATDFHAVLARKAEMDSDAYLAELEQVLLQMARLQLEIDQETGWQGSSE